MDTEPRQNQAQVSEQTLSIPLAIVIAGVLIAGALYFTKRGDSIAVLPEQDDQIAESAGETANINPITEDDHIRGNPNAKVVVVEYSDFECPFCKRFHPTMKQIMDEYGKGGEVAWVWRHFPLDSLHPVKARKEAVASECAVALGGNDAFWKFADRFFELSPSNNQTDIDTVLPQIAQEIGLPADQFADCLGSGKYDAHIQNDLDNAIATGGNGTPWSIVVTKSGKTYPLSGSQPYAAVKQLIDIALTDK